MWGRVLLAIMGVSALWGAGTAIFSRRPRIVIHSQHMSDGTIVKTEQLRTLRWWERVLFSLFGPAGVWMCVFAATPDSWLTGVVTTVVVRFYVVVVMVALSAGLVWSAGWLAYRRVLRRALPRSIRGTPAPADGAAASPTSSTGVLDLVDEAADRVAVQMTVARLLRVLASNRGSAVLLAGVACISGIYIATLVPAVVRGDYEKVGAIVTYLVLAAVAAEVLVFVVLPILVVVALIVAVAKRAWNHACELGIAVTIMAVGYTVAWRNGVLGPLFELLRKLPISFQP